MPTCLCVLCACVQFAFNTLQRVSPVSHGVCNVVKRVAIIFSSVFFFGQVRILCLISPSLRLLIFMPVQLISMTLFVSDISMRRVEGYDCWGWDWLCCLRKIPC